MRRLLLSLGSGLFLFLTAAIAAVGAEESPAEDFIAGYHVEARALILAESLEVSGGKLKPFADMSPREIATIYHELWHAYFLECETPQKPGAPGGTLYQAFRAQVDHLYPDAPAEKRMEIQEEAVADFIDAVIETTAQMKRFLASKTPERREEIRKESRYLNLYAQLFRDKYQGYYTKAVHPAAKTKGGEAATSPSLRPAVSPADHLTSAAMEIPLSGAKTVLADFIRDARAFGLPVRYLEKAVEKMRGVVFIETSGGDESPKSEVVWSKGGFDPREFPSVAQVLFEGILTPNPLETFSEQSFMILRLSR